MVRGRDPHDLAAEKGKTTILMFLMMAMIISKYMTNMLGLQIMALMTKVVL